MEFAELNLLLYQISSQTRFFFSFVCFLMSLYRLSDQLLAPPAADSDGESDGSDRVPVPNFQNSFSQAFERALLQLDTGGALPPQALVEPGLWPVHCPSVITAGMLFAFAVQLIVHVVVFQRRKEARRRRRSRSSCSAPPWSTQSRGPSSSRLLIPPAPPPPPQLIFPLSASGLFWNFKL